MILPFNSHRKYMSYNMTSSPIFMHSLICLFLYMSFVLRGSTFLLHFKVNRSACALYLICTLWDLVLPFVPFWLCLVSQCFQAPLLSLKQCSSILYSKVENLSFLQALSLLNLNYTLMKLMVLQLFHNNDDGTNIKIIIIWVLVVCSALF